MKKSELYAKYYLYNQEVEEITREEFYSTLLDEKDNSSFNDGSTSCHQINTDGMTYYMFASTWNVGWHGDRDGDNFFCKVKCLTKEERDRVMKVLGAH